MRAIQCDRCGAFITGDQGYKGVTVMTKHIPDKIEDASVKHMDLCFACSDELVRMMAEPRAKAVGGQA